MHKFGNHTIQLVIIILLVLQQQHNPVIAQNNNASGGAAFESRFLKNNLSIKTGELSLNIVRVYNRGDQDAGIKPVLKVPPKWGVFSASFVETNVQAGDSVSFPFSIRIPKIATATESHEIIFQAFSLQNKLIISDTFSVQAEAFHKWDVVVPEERFFFYPRRNVAEFEVRLHNAGNVPETINLEIRPDKKLKVVSKTGEELIIKIELPPNTDTSFFYKASYTYDKKRVFDISRVQVLAHAGGRQLYRSVTIEKYEDTYAPLKVNKNKLHQTEVGFRTSSGNSDILPYINASGKAGLKNDAMFNYQFTYHDLTETENVVENSYYQFLYTKNEFNIGIGAFSSMLGRNLYNRNSLMISDAVELSPTSTMLGFASVGYVDKKTSGALGYNYSKNEFEMRTAAAYSVDGTRQVNTGSFVHKIPEIKINDKHRLGLTFYSYVENHNSENKYMQAGVAYDLNYVALFGERFSLNFNNIFGSPDIPGSQMGLLSLNLKSKYILSDKSRYLSLHLNNSTKDYYFRNTEGVKSPDINIINRFAKLFFYSTKHKKHRWSFGPSIEFYNSKNPLIGLGDEQEFNVRKYRLEYKGIIGIGLSVNLKGGLSEEAESFASQEYSKTYDFHFLGEYNKNGYGLRVAYDYGPMVSSGLYQYALDAGNNSILVSPFVLKDFFDGIVGLSLFTNFTYKIDLDYLTLNVNPRIETYVVKDFYVVVGGTFSYVRQAYNENIYDRSFQYMELAVKKRWGRTGKNKPKQKLLRLKVLLFQDNNGNGLRDPGEDGIPFVKTRILLKSTPDKKAREALPVDITLLSNDVGYATYNKIPEGYYEIFINPLSMMREYFYVNQSIESVEVIKNMVYEIPFQKARKITGQIIVKRRKFIADDDGKIDLKNIRVTAYNQKGHSYSAFTDDQGRFILFAPGGLTYYLRIENVFGNEFRILQNDIMVKLSDDVLSPVIFNVVESSRKINIKKSKPKNAEPGKPDIQKIKVLKGEVYEQAKNNRADKNAAPDFNIGDASTGDHEMIVGYYYVVVGKDKDRGQALRLLEIYREQGIDVYLGLNDYTGEYFVFTAYFEKKQDTGNEIRKLRNKKIKNVEIYEMTTDSGK